MMDRNPLNVNGPILKVEGVERFHGANHVVIPDRIEAGTFTTFIITNLSK